MRGFTIAKVMSTIQLALHNSRKNPVIKTAISAFGYDDNRMSEGDALYSEVQQLRFVYQVKRNDALCHQEACKEKTAEAKRQYMSYLKMARRALRDYRYHWNLLDMNGRRAYGFTQWTDQAKKFYHGALNTEEIRSKLATTYNITVEKLEQGLALIEEAISNLQTLSRLQAESQAARADWDSSLNRLKQWYYIFRLFLRSALDHIPQYFTAIGLSSKGKPGRNKVFPLVESFNLPLPPAALRGRLRGERQGAAPPGPPICAALDVPLR